MKGAERRAALEAARLYLVTRTLPPDIAEALLGAGVDLMQLREKDLEAMDVIEAGDPLREVCERQGVPFVVNDRPDVAFAMEADGVHLGQQDLPPRIARDLLGPDAVIGRSTHSRDDIRAAIEGHEQGCVDYMAVGPVYTTPTKPGRPAVGTELVAFAAEHVSFPWFAIGGIDLANVEEVLAAGARRVVVVRAIVEAPDPIEATFELRDLITSSGRKG